MSIHQAAVLVTGASGFVGRAVLERLRSDMTYQVRGAVRRDGVARLAGVEYVKVGPLGRDTDWSAALAQSDVVIHTAARVHVMRDDAPDEFRRINVEGTLNLVSQAIAAGVRRFIFVSSVKVHGEESAPHRPLDPDDVPAPRDDYGRSKLEAEQGLRSLLERAGREWVIVRPPLVYGPGVRANFLSLLRLLRRGLPLPFASVSNRRSLVAVENLAAVLEHCASRAGAANQVFFAADGEDLSTPELLRRLSRAMGKEARLFPVPTGALLAAAALAGRRDVAQRLLGNLQVDARKTRERLGWHPVIAVDEALENTARAFLASESS